MQVGLVDVTTLGSHQGGAVPSDEASRSVVEADQAPGSLGTHADLGAEPGPQTFAAPACVGRQLLDTHLSARRHRLTPREGDLRVHRPARGDRKSTRLNSSHVKISY